MLSHSFPHRATSELRASCLWYEKLRMRPSLDRLRPCVGELSLEEMLNDPIVQYVMRSDRVSRRDVENLMAHASAAIRGYC